MEIFVLVVVSIFALSSLIALPSAGDANEFFIIFGGLVSAILAIIFQSMAIAG